MNVFKFFGNKWFGLSVYILSVVLFFIFYLQAMGKAYRPFGYDMDAYLLGANYLINGQNPYISPEGTPFIYIYPLLLAFVFIPLTYIPEFVLHTAWYLVNVSCLLFSGLLMLKSTQSYSLATSREKILLSLFLGVIVSFSAIQNSLLNGQVNPVVLFCCVMFFYSYQHDNKGNGWKSCIWLALAIAIKLTPAVLLGFYLVRKKIGHIAFAIICAVFFMFLPAILVGEDIFSFYETYINTFILYKVTATSDIIGNVEGFAPGFNIQSVIGLSYPQVFHLAWVKWLGVGVVILILFYIDVVTSRLDRSSQWIGFSAYLVASLLLSPMGEKHHLIIIEPIFVIAISAYIFNGKWKLYCPVAIGVSFLVLRTLTGLLLKDKIYLFIPLMWLLLSLAYIAWNINRMSQREI